MRTRFLIFAVAVAAVAIGGAIVSAQTSAPAQAPVGTSNQGITYPVPDLGNCANQAGCKAYCNDPAHMDACISFAKAHGLMTDAEASTAENFKSALQSGGGPGGCKTPDECQAFCSTISNLQACMSFAQAHGLNNGPQMQMGQKVLAYIKSGGQMPGGCTSQASCETYCGDFTHAKECYDFAAKAGITQAAGSAGPGGSGGPGGGMPSPNQLQKLAALTAQGQTPGGCTSKDQCETYCEDSSHRAECLAFAQKMGFVTADQASKIQTSGFTGPGGCNSDSSCQAYCNDQAHRDECYRFAKDHGLLSQGDVQNAEQGLVRLRAGLQNAPAQVTACLQSALGANVINDIQSGKLTPGPDVGNQMKNCFDKFGGNGDPRAAFQNVPPDVKQCLIQKLGQDTFAGLSSGKAQPTPEMADTVRVCFENQQFNQNSGPGGRNGMPPPNFRQMLQNAPPGIGSCLRDKLGSDFAKLQSGDTSGMAGLQDKIRGCFEDFRPQPPEQGTSQENGGMMQPGGQTGPGQGMMPAQGFQFPRGIGDCVRQAVGEDAFNAIKEGKSPTASMQSAVAQCMAKMQQNPPTSVGPGQNPPQGQFPTMPPPGMMPSGTLPAMPPPPPPAGIMPGGTPLAPNSAGSMPPPPPVGTATTTSGIFQSFLSNALGTLQKLVGR